MRDFPRYKVEYMWLLNTIVYHAICYGWKLKKHRFSPRSIYLKLYREGCRRLYIRISDHKNDQFPDTKPGNYSVHHRSEMWRYVALMQDICSPGKI